MNAPVFPPGERETHPLRIAGFQQQQYRSREICIAVARLRPSELHRVESVSHYFPRRTPMHGSTLPFDLCAKIPTAVTRDIGVPAFGGSLTLDAENAGIWLRSRTTVARLRFVSRNPVCEGLVARQSQKPRGCGLGIQRRPAGGINFGRGIESSQS